jgi:hypothetical protein
MKPFLKKKRIKMGFFKRQTKRKSPTKAAKIVNFCCTSRTNYYHDELGSRLAASQREKHGARSRSHRAHHSLLRPLERQQFNIMPCFVNWQLCMVETVARESCGAQQWRGHDQIKPHKLSEL